MSGSKKYTNYQDFLADEDFIRWILLKDKALESNWNQYIRENPECENEFRKAIAIARKIKLTDNRMDDKDFILLHGRIRETYHHTGRRLKLRYVVGYVAAACMAAVILSVLYFSPLKDTRNTGTLLTDNMIVGQNLEAEDISLITSSGKNLFSNDINLEVKDNGSVHIRDVDGQEAATVTVEKETMNKLVVPFGKRSFLNLADGTRVWVNSGSVLEFPSRFDGNTREINLTGEIYIEVTPDSKKPFYVNTSELQVKVYGTRFNVSSYADQSLPSVVLVQGKVSVKTPETGESIMLPNEKITYANNLLVREQVDASRYTSWKDGYLITDHTPINEVLQQVGRYYNLTFNMGNNIDLQSRTCTGKIYLSSNLDNVMTTISLLSSTEYKRDEKTICINLKEN